jgi:hypothetical protein
VKGIKVGGGWLGPPPPYCPACLNQWASRAVDQERAMHEQCRATLKVLAERR